MSGLTVGQLIELADKAKASVCAGHMLPTDEVYVSLEVLKDGDERTYSNRVYGGDVVEAKVARTLAGKQYVHLQLMGEPNFEVYT